MHHYFQIFNLNLISVQILNKANRIFIFGNNDTQKLESMHLKMDLTYFSNLSSCSYTLCKLHLGNTQITSDVLKFELWDIKTTVAPPIVKILNL